MSNLSKKLALAAAAVVATAAPTAQAAPPVMSPDGRGYELVTPQGLASKAAQSGAAVSDDGTKVTFLWGATLPQGSAGYFLDTAFSALRGPTGWTISQLADIGNGERTQLASADPNTQAAVLLRGTSSHDGGVWVRDAAGQITRLLTVSQKFGFPIETMAFGGAAADYSRVYFAFSKALLPGAATGGGNIYGLVDGDLRLISREPDGTPATMVVGSRNGDPHSPDAVSRDGKVVVMSDLTGTARLLAYAEGETTVVVSASQLAVPHPTQSAQFGGMSDDGKHIVFTSPEQLTDAAQTDGDTANELYSYDRTTGTLNVLTPGFNGSARVRDVTAVSRDGRRVYFVADGALPGTDAVDGSPNLYLADAAENTVTFVATLAPDDTPLWSEIERTAYAVITDDGGRLAFLSKASITGPENVDANGLARLVLYVYDADARTIACASCGPKGGHVSHGAAFTLSPQLSQSVDESVMPTYGVARHYTRGRSMSADGHRVFFITREALVPQDINGRLDVYVYEDGQTRLVSPGRGPYDARFMGSSSDGGTAVFSTDEPIVAFDQDTLPDMYVARVGGGYPEPDDPSPAPCSGDACQGLPVLRTSPPTPASIGFTGPETTERPRVVKPSVTKGRVAVTRRRVRGRTVILSVRAPGAGRISASGPRVRTSRRSVTRAGTFTVRVVLSAGARRSLERHGRLRVSLRVGFVPAAGKASSTTVAVTVKG